MDKRYHVPVLVESVLRYLPANPAGIYIDGTLGGGGHAESILKRLSPQGRLVGFDRDPEAIEAARGRLEAFGPRAIIVHDSIANLSAVLAAHGMDQIDGMLLDLGISSHQIDEGGRGFSYLLDGPLDMRMDPEGDLDARAVVNGYSEERLASLFLRYGEERHWKRIAAKTVKERAQHRIETTAQLAAVVTSVVGPRMATKSLARIFQAIRIEVNDELDTLSRALEQGISLLRSGGRVVVISYHSLEDRIVKQLFNQEARRWVASGSKYLPDRSKEPRVQILTKKPLVAGDAERTDNPRSRSAKLRAAEKI